MVITPFWWIHKVWFGNLQEVQSFRRYSCVVCQWFLQAKVVLSEQWIRTSPSRVLQFLGTPWATVSSSDSTSLDPYNLQAKACSASATWSHAVLSYQDWLEHLVPTPLHNCSNHLLSTGHHLISVLPKILETKGQRLLLKPSCCLSSEPVVEFPFFWPSFVNDDDGADSLQDSFGGRSYLNLSQVGSDFLILFISCCSCNNLPQTWWSKTYFRTLLAVKRLRLHASRYQPWLGS